MDKPKFSDLTPEQVNDLIATKIMGWHKDFHHYGEEPEFVTPYECWIGSHEHIPRHTRSTIYSECGTEVFNPYRDLNDCWEAEEKILNPPRVASNDYSYKYRQYLLVITSKDHRLHNASQDGGFLHATAVQKCEAMLRAIGAIL